MVEGLRRVVVTGLGAVTPIGNDVTSYWEGLSSGRNGVAPITLFDASAHACRFAAEVKDFDPSAYIEPKESKRWDRFCQFGVVAAKQAVAQAGLTIDDSNAHRIGTAIGSGVGGLLMMETQAHVLEGKGPSRVSPFTVPMMIPNMATGLTAIAIGAKGPSTAVLGPFAPIAIAVRPVAMFGIIIGTVNGLTRDGPLPSSTWAWVSIISRPPTPEPMAVPMRCALLSSMVNPAWATACLAATTPN